MLLAPGRERDLSAGMTLDLPRGIARGALEKESRLYQPRDIERTSPSLADQPGLSKLTTGPFRNHRPQFRSILAIRDPARVQASRSSLS